MRFAQFQSNSPVDHLSRMLGQLDRMGFALDSICVSPSGAGLSDVRIVFQPKGLLSAQVFADRVALLRGVQGFKQGRVA